MSAIQAIGEGWDTTGITDTSGGISIEAHQVVIQRMIAAGVNMMTWLAVMAEWQRDWARAETVPALAEVMKSLAGATGIVFLWVRTRARTPACPQAVPPKARPTVNS